MTFSKTIGLALFGGVALLAGCGGDSTTDGGPGNDMGMTGTDLGMTMTDGGVTCSDPDSAVADLGMPAPADCPATSPAPMNQTGQCCYRDDNSTHMNNPRFRLAALKITAPFGMLTSSVVGGLLQQGFDAETFNWIMEIQGLGTASAMIKTGYGVRNDIDGTFSYQMGGAPPPGDPARWNPVMTTATAMGENVTTAPYNNLITVPSFDSSMPSHPLLIEFPIFGLQLLAFPMSEARACVGDRGGASWLSAGGGRLSAFIRVADAKPRLLDYATLHTTLCGVIAGSLMDATYCDMPQSGWATKPDSLCSASGCTPNTCAAAVCDPATAEGGTGMGGLPGCNAWHLLGSFVAQGVTVN